MDITSFQQNKSESEPGLKDLLDLHKKDVMLSINCHAIATVQSFDDTKQTITATINYKKTYFKTNNDGSYVPVLYDYPILLDVPVITMQGGTASLTFPIAKGDSCLILFNDRDLDNWFHTGQVSQTATPRLHSFSDGIALVGLRASNNPIANYDMTRVVLQNGLTMVGLSDTLVKIANATTTLKQVIEGLMDVISTGFGGATPAVGNPLSPATVAALTAYKTTVESLLE